MKVHARNESIRAQADRTAASMDNRSRRTQSQTFPRILTFGILLLLWLVLSGQYDPFHITLGVISCLIVTLFSGDLLFPGAGITDLFRLGLGIVLYIPWLIYQILMANFHILRVVFHPKMLDLIDPQIIRFQSSLTQELALVIFANSITLTPGTITVYVSVDGDFQVHAIDKKSAEPLPGEMEARVGRIFAGQS
ncbi:MAG: Na+/H+ antiporter subunit E [Deltaproteobacteria bacterium]|nr:Na+/H+ antiporter subunit E [Deltaproteobacteria bacterium]